MDKEEQLVKVFTGSLVDAEYIKHILEQNGIGALLKNAMKESLVAGWVSATSEDAARILVAERNKTKAGKLIREYLDSENKENDDANN